jgi:hypothetical protein
MKRRFRNVTAVLALPVSACFVLHEGREQSITFSTSFAPAEVRARALQRFARGGYMSAEGTGTRVRVHAVTDEVVRGRRRQADQVSGTRLRPRTTCRAR